MKPPQFQLNVGTCYVTELLGLRRPVYKVGKTAGSVRNRIRSPSTFAPLGICVHRVQIFFDYPAAEDRIHFGLAKWHIPAEETGQAREMFSAPLSKIQEVVDAHVALQKDFAKEQAKMFETLRDNGFLLERPNVMLDELLEAKVFGKLTLKSAIIRSINSSSHEEKIRTALLDFGIEVSRKSMTAKVVCAKMLGALCPDSKARGAASVLANVSHFNSLGNPIFA